MDIAAIIVRRPGGEFFVHQRSDSKKTYPGLFGIGAGGSLEPAESPAEAARRELWEETGISAEPSSLFSFDFSDDLQKHRLHIFEVATEKEACPDIREWQWAGWLSQGELDSLDAEGKLCPDTRIFYGMYKERADRIT